jgi:hypothetical protein
LVYELQGFVSLWSISIWAQASSKGWARKIPLALIATGISAATERLFLGVVRWVPLSVNTLYPLGSGLNQSLQEVRCGSTDDALMNFHECELFRMADCT